MNNYEYIVASLPDITTGWKFGEKGPEDYLEDIVSLCSEKDNELIDFLLSGAIPYEFRTTVVRELHNAEDLIKAAERIKGAQGYYLQGFVDSEHVFKQGLSAYTAEEMEALRQSILHLVPSAKLRGVEAKQE